MRILPRSIRGRLLAAALVFTAAALVFAGFSIGHVLERFVQRGLNERLDTQIALLAHGVRPDGVVDRSMLQEIGPFTQHRRGWSWRIDSPGGALSSETVVPVRKQPRPEMPVNDPRRAAFADRKHRPWSTADTTYYYRSLERQTAAGPVRITVTAPRYIVDRPLQEALQPLFLSLGALGVLLVAATLLQLRFGLRPLARLRAALADIRAGRINRIPAEQPPELSEMVGELNGLLDENEAALERARGHVSNLAHSLKTPLATLSIRLSEEGRDPDGALAALVQQIDGSIRHHLGRARAASPGAPGRPQLALAERLAEITGALVRIHASRNIVVDQQIDPSLSVKCDPQDFDEMAGNLLDNAWKWARGRIRITAAREGQNVRLVIEDDGPGLSEEAARAVLVPGVRLDEQGDGHGFGLSIARELAELHGGALALDKGRLGGLRVTLTLPS